MTDGTLIFGQFRLDLDRRELLRDQETVRLGSRALDILRVLASARGALVTKDELMARVWPGVVVEENNIHVHVSALRKALDAEGRPNCIVTVPGRGYRLIGVVDCLPTSSAPATASAGQPAVAPRLPIVVLPLGNLSNDPEQQYFADGITEDLTTDLSRIAGSFVISRNTAFTYRGSRLTRSKSAASWGCAMSWKAAFAGGQPGSRQRPADRCRDRCASVGRAVRPRHQRYVRPARRNHQPDRGYTQP
jgi:DNA-binding winged helix-turn-helix (wHTH) protein